MQPTTRLHVSGHRFLVHRMEHALLRGDTRMLDDPPRGQSISLVAGVVLTAVAVAVCAVLALVLFSITVVSIPLLLDRESDFVTAMITSVKTVAASPVPMIGWGIFVTLAVIVSSVPMFLGLIVALPVLGHATWHLYRKAVAPA